MKGSGRGKGWHAAAEEIREKLGRFAGRPRFNQEFEEAFEFFFGESVESLQETLDEADFDRFMEWFIHDYRLSNHHRLIEIFDLEHGADLSRHARRLLRAWQQANLTLLEMQADEGETYSFLDVLTGNTLQIVSPPFDASLTRWALVIGRPLPVGNVWELSAAATVLPPTIKEPLVQLLRGEYRRYRHAHGSIPVQRFLREQGFIFNDLLAEVDAENAPGYIEGDEAYRVVHCRAVFQVRDAKKVMARLLAYPDIQMGRQHRLVWYEPQGARPKRILAEMTISGGRLQVYCWSRERLNQAKTGLVERLKGLVLHLVDAFEEPHSHGGAPGAALCTLKEAELPRTDLDDHGDEEDHARHNGNGFHERDLETSAKAAYDDYLKSWLVEPLGALNGYSPQELLHKPLGRVRVVELLKQLEQLQQARLRKGRGLCTAAELRSRMGLVEESGVTYPLDAAPDLWNSTAEQGVVKGLRHSLKGGELSEYYLDSVVWMWWDYCRRAHPRVRKVAAWAAALHYCLGFVENWGLTQNALAEEYGVAAGTVSKNARGIARVLKLQPFDDRYCVEHPVDGLLERLGQIHDTMSAGGEDLTAVNLAVADRVREEVHRFAGKHDGLQDRAQSFFTSHVGCTRQEPVWRDSFLDWFYFDWPVPVMGGRTLAQEVLENEELPEADRDILSRWVECHPSFWVVEGVVEPSAGEGDEAERGPRLTLREVTDGSLTVVDWMRFSEPIGPKDLIFARLVPVGDMVISLGQVVAYPPRWKAPVQKAIEEERTLVNRWNGRYVAWDEFRARYAERLYAVAFRTAQEDDLE